MKYNKFSSLFIFLSFFILFYYYIGTCQYAFNFELNNNGQYYAAFAALSSWSMFLLVSLLKGHKSDFKQIFAMVFVNVFILCLLFNRYYSFSNEYFTHLTAIIIIYVILLSANIRELHYILILLVVTFFWQLIIACKQMHQFPWGNGRIYIQGTLGNSGVFSCYLVSQLPFFYYFLFGMTPIYIKKMLPSIKFVRRFIHPIKVSIFGLALYLVVMIIWKSQSRTALIALVILLLAFFVMNYGNIIRTFFHKMPKVLSIPIACCLFIGLSYVLRNLFYLKKLSAMGRVMALDISTRHLGEHLWLGTGIGRFTWYYPQWQSQYFATYPNPPKDYFLSAGESYIIFNEYVQIFLTIGFPCSIILLWLLRCFFYAKSSSYKTLLNATKLTMIAILATGLSSYPFHVNVLLLVIALCCSIVAKVNTKTYQLSTTPFTSNRIANRFFFVFLTAIAGVAVFSAFKGWRAKQEWDQLRNQLYEPPFVIKKEYDRLDKIFKYDGKFLTQYGLFLSENTPNGEDAAKTLEKAKKYFISKVTIESLAKSYKQTGDYNRAIENYKWLSDYMPNRFGAKLELVKLYNIICDTSNVRKTATILLTMPVKIPSREIDKIKNETKSILDQLP